jgi:hypothetical protein
MVVCWTAQAERTYTEFIGKLCFYASSLPSLSIRPVDR